MIYNFLSDCTAHSKLALHVITLIKTLKTLELINTEKSVMEGYGSLWAEPVKLGSKFVCTY
jgi:hypothetical protein